MRLKTKRKFAKISALANKLDGIEVSAPDTQSNILLIGNGGLENAVSSQDLSEIFSKFGQINAIWSHPKRPYALVKFSDEIAKTFLIEAIAETNGKVHVIKGREITFYVGFVKDVDFLRDEEDVVEEMPEGLIYVKDFISEDQENQLVRIVETKLRRNEFSTLQNRKVIHFGKHFDYSNNSAIDCNSVIVQPIPAICFELLEKASSFGYIKETPDQLTVNCYEPGDGIPAHVDSIEHFGDEIICISLLSALVMEFIDEDESNFLR